MEKGIDVTLFATSDSITKGTLDSIIPCGYEEDKNVDPKVVADQLGHTLDVNLNVYTQTSLERKIEAVETLESSLVN